MTNETFRRISHIGVLVNDVDEALKFWCGKLGFKQFDDRKIEVEGLHSVFISLSGKPGEMTLEIMEPLDKTDQSNAVVRRLAKHGEGFYHLAVVVDDVPQSITELKSRGLSLIGRDATDPGAQGRWLIHPKDANGVMIEGVAEWGVSKTGT